MFRAVDVVTSMGMLWEAIKESPYGTGTLSVNASVTVPVP
jgi:hypothetical protein